MKYLIKKTNVGYIVVEEKYDADYGWVMNSMSSATGIDVGEMLYCWMHETGIAEAMSRGAEDEDRAEELALAEVDKFWEDIEAGKNVEVEY